MRVSIKPAEDRRETRRRLESLPASFLQTIHGLVDPEDDESFSRSGCLNEG